MSSPDRQDLIQNAILFLNDPKVQSSSLTSRITFLESKGLNESEIQEALRRARDEGDRNGARDVSSGVGGGSDAWGGYTGYEGRSGGYGYGQMMAPPPPRRDWRDLFIMAVVSGGVVYGLAALARKYLLPHLRPPSTTSFQSTSTSLTEQYDQLSSLLTDLSTHTTSLQTSLDTDRDRLNGVVTEVEQAVQSVRDGEEKWREEMRDVRGEVESVRELVPRMIEKHAGTQSAALAELQSELRSLKTLLQSRQGAFNAPASGSGTTTPQANGGSSTLQAANNLLGGKSRGIPAWQLPSSSGGGGSGGSGSAGSSLSGSVVLERDGDTNGQVHEVRDDGV